MTMQTKRPLVNNQIAILFENITNEVIQKDSCIQEIIELQKDPKFYINFTYALYADHSMCSENLFIPIFHTYSLCSGPKLVILRPKTYDILALYDYHSYFICGETEEEEKDFKELVKNFPNHKIKHIKNVRQLINEL